jgi:hypothetical protein
VWDELRERVEVERRQLRILLDKHRSLLLRCATSPPNDIELSALAAMLHSFYNGVENILKRITIELNGEALSGQYWHKELLDAMLKTTAGHGPVRPRRCIVCSGSTRNSAMSFVIRTPSICVGARWNRSSAKLNQHYSASKPNWKHSSPRGRNENLKSLAEERELQESEMPLSERTPNFFGDWKGHAGRRDSLGTPLRNRG